MIRKLRKESQLGDGWHGCGSSHRKSENHFGTISKIFLYTHVYIIYIYIRIYIPPFWVWPDLSCIDSSWLVDFPILGRSGHDVLPGSESRGWWIFQQTMRLATRGY